LIDSPGCATYVQGTERGW